LEQPKLNTTTTQQVVNNDSNREVAAEEHASSSTTTGLTEQLPEVNSTQELSTPNNEPVKIDTSDQPKSPAVPDEPQEPVINTSETDAKELPENFPTPNPKNADSDVLKGASNENYLKVEETPNSKELKRESSTINVFNRGLELRLADDIQQKLEDYKNPKNNSKYRIKIHCSKGDFNINFSKKENEDGSVSLLINTLQKIGNKQVLNDINKIKSSLGFKKGLTSVEIDSIQKYQPSAKPDGQAQGSGDEPNQSSFDNKSVKDDDKEADNPQPEISANGSAPTDSSSFDIVSSQETTPDELQEPDEDKELARQSEADQKAPANDDRPNSLVAKPEVQTASNDLSHKSQSQ
jgi:hypothetical protein